MADDIITPKDICEIDIQSQMEKWVDIYGLGQILGTLSDVCHHRETPPEGMDTRPPYKRVWLVLDGLIEELFPDEEV